MKIRLASALLALALPLAAQEPAADTNEVLFYKAFYLEKGPKDFIGAMALYEQFLAKAPEHKLAKEAATQQFHLLDRVGKSKERDAFKAKHEKLIGDIRPTAGGGDNPAGDAPRGAGRGAERGGENRMDMQARIAETEKQLAKAKEAGDEAKVKELTQQLERMKNAGSDRARAGQGRGGLMRVMQSNKKVSEMNAEEMTALKDAVGQSSGMIERMREMGNEDAANKLQTNVDALKKALDANNHEDAQKALDAIKAAMPQGRRRGEGGGPGGGQGGAGGGGGQNGGGNNGGGGGR